jgi:hypothetical protein
MPATSVKLWNDPTTQKLCAQIWSCLAKRYKGVPNNQLSFNLINEPNQVSSQDYINVVKILVQAIRNEDPNRLIIADGIDSSMTPVPELSGMQIAQSFHFYTPLTLTHYRAPWEDTNSTFPMPQWPITYVGNFLSGPGRDFTAPLTINGEFQANDEITLHVEAVSNYAEIVFKADGKVFYDSGEIRCKKGSGPWKTAVYNAEYNIYQNIFDCDYKAALPMNAKKIEIEVPQGDWVSFTQVAITASGNRVFTYTPGTGAEWGLKPPVLSLDQGSGLMPTDNVYSGQKKIQQDIEQWANLKNQGSGVMVGEFGCFNKTPHGVALNWMQDMLSTLKSADIGWAMWNFRGDFGVLDSGRSDVQYESFNGHKLDREMLQLLQQS